MTETAIIKVKKTTQREGGKPVAIIVQELNSC